MVLQELHRHLRQCAPLCAYDNIRGAAGLECVIWAGTRWGPEPSEKHNVVHTIPLFLMLSLKQCKFQKDFPGDFQV